MDKYKVSWTDLPEDIRELMLQRQVEQDNKRSPAVFLNYITEGRPKGGFNWSQTPEGDHFWSRVLHHTVALTTKERIDYFRRKYPLVEEDETFEI